jgi:hypothetical protein
MEIEKLIEGRVCPNEVKQALLSDGIFIAPGLITGPAMDQLRSEFERIFSERNPAVAPGIHPSGAMTRIDTRRSQASEFPTILSIFLSETFRQIACSYLPEGSTFNDCIVATHDYNSGQITDTHFDSLRTLKFFIYLSGTDIDNGAFQYARGTHTENSAYRDRFLENGGQLLDIQNIPADDEAVDLEAICGPAGTLMIFDTDGFHSAGQILGAGKERRVLRSRSVFANQGKLHPKRLSPMWLRRRLGVFPPRIPEIIPGRYRSAGSSRRKGKY